MELQVELKVEALPCKYISISCPNKDFFESQTEQYLKEQIGVSGNSYKKYDPQLRIRISVGHWQSSSPQWKQTLALPISPISEG